jgi:hypothetical protein
VVEKAAKLDRDTFGVAVGQGPWQRWLEEIGGIKPLAFDQFDGEMGPSLEALLASMAKRGADEMADRYLIENREAAVVGMCANKLTTRCYLIGATVRGYVAQSTGRIGLPNIKNNSESHYQGEQELQLGF